MESDEKLTHWKCPKCKNVFRNDSSSIDARVLFSNLPDRLTVCRTCGHYISTWSLLKGEYGCMSAGQLIGSPFAFAFVAGIVGAFFDHFLIGALIGGVLGGLLALVISVAQKTDPFDQMPTKPKAAALVEYAVVRADAKDFAGAKKALEDAITVNPADAEAYRVRAMMQFSHGDLAGVIQDVSKAIEIDPGCAEAYCIRGMARKEQNESDSALVDFDKAVSLQSDAPHYYLHRAGARQELGQLDAAAQDYRKSTRS